MKSNFNPPKIYILESALLDIYQEAMRHPNIETGWGQCGIVFPNGSVVITHILLPTTEDISRQVAFTQVGGEVMGDAVAWLIRNERQMRKVNHDKRKAKFTFVFKGHSHHRLAFKQHSSTDVKSVRTAVVEDGLDVVVSPLVIIDKDDLSYSNGRTGSIRIRQETSVEVKFYYYSEAMHKDGINDPILITPNILEANIDDQLHLVPPIGWKFARYNDFSEQIRHLRNYGALVIVQDREIEGGPPTETVITARKQNWSAILQIVVPWDYPNSPPKFNLIKNGNNPTEQVDYSGADHLLDGELWHPGEDFIESIFRLEARGEL